MRTVYVNGVFCPEDEGRISIFDRGFLFADGVYEVVLVQNGVMVDEMPHLDRLDRSLDELRIAHPMSRGALRSVMRELVRLNRIRNGLVYMQVTRGVAKRDHPFPKNAKPSIVLTAKRISMPSQETVENGVKVITIRDIRWERCDIKSVSLLPNILGKQEARDNGAFEAWQVDADGNVTEGTSSNAWIVTQDGELVTRPATNDILNGITRLSILKLAERQGLKYVERAFSVDEAKKAEVTMEAEEEQSSK